MTKAAKEKEQDQVWAPARYDDDTEGLDRGDATEIAETEAEDAPVAEEVAESAAVEPEEAAEPEEDIAPEAETAEIGDVEPADPPKTADTDKKQHMVPKDRLDQELAKRRQLENKLKELEEQAKVAPEAEATVDFDFDNAETKYMEAVLDGETDNAKKIRAEIRQMERQQLQNEFQSSLQETTQRTQSQVRLDAAVLDIVADYPQLDANGAEPDQDLINETNELMTGFLTAGYDPVDALKKAVGYTTASLSLNMDANEPASIANAQSRNLAEEKVAIRQKEGAQKRETAAKQQPPKLSGESQRSHTEDNVVDIFKLSEKDFKAMSDEQLRKLRGDFG